MVGNFLTFLAINFFPNKDIFNAYIINPHSQSLPNLAFLMAHCASTILFKMPNGLVFNRFTYQTPLEGIETNGKIKSLQ